jgi:hypothetical protein
MLNASSGTVNLSLDGVSVVMGIGLATLPPGGMTSIAAGILHVDPPTSTAEAWFDELAVSTSPLPCD